MPERTSIWVRHFRRLANDLRSSPRMKAAEVLLMHNLPLAALFMVEAANQDHKSTGRLAMHRWLAATMSVVGLRHIKRRHRPDPRTTAGSEWSAEVYEALSFARCLVPDQRTGHGCM